MVNDNSRSRSGAAHPTASLGARYNPFDPDFLRDPHAFFTQAREVAPV